MNTENNNNQENIFFDGEPEINESYEDIYDVGEKKLSSRKKLSGRNFKQGMFSSLITILVIAIVIIANMFIGKLDLKVDLTNDDVYTLTDETVLMADQINDDINIYFIAKEDDKYQVLQNVVNQYDKLPHITVTWKDPELYPQFAAQYTDEELEGNDVIVVNKKTGASKFIPFSDMYIIENIYTTSGGDTKYTLDAEGQITSAIQYVTSSIHSKMYMVTAHGEREIGEGVKALINKANVDIEELDVMSMSKIPDDCSTIFINGPTVDISDEELEMYKSYLDNGGNMILSVAYTEKDMKNYNSLIEYYGVKPSPGVIVESDGNYLNNYPAYVIAGFETVGEEITTNISKKDFVICPISSMLELEDESKLRDTLKISSIAVSSEDSYAKLNPDPESYEKEDGDPVGPFELIVQASDTFKDKSSKVVIFSSPYTFEDDWIDYYTCRNINVLINSIDWMRGEQQQSVTIPARDLSAVYLDVPKGAPTLWAAIFIIIVPLSIIGVGFVIWFVRRKR